MGWLRQTLGKPLLMTYVFQQAQRQRKMGAPRAHRLYPRLTA